MALNCSVTNLLQEADAAIAVRDAQLRELNNVTNIFTGPFSHTKGAEHWPDNFIFQYLSYALPKTGYNNPRFKVKSSQSAPKRLIEQVEESIAMMGQAAQMGVYDPMAAMSQTAYLQAELDKIKRPSMVSEAMMWGLNQWVNTADLDEDILHFILNCLVMYGVMKTVQIRKGDKRLPEWQNVSPRRFGFDPLTLLFGGARYCFEQIIRDKESLIEEAQNDPESGWDIGALDGLGEDSETSTIRQNVNDGGVPARGEIAYMEFWVREDLPESYGPDEGFHGTIYTVAKGSGNYLRDPFPYYGPAWGPYCLGGVYPVVDSPFPLSPVMANYAQAQDHNAQVKAGLAGAKSYKRIVFCPAGQASARKALQDAPHDYIIPVKGLQKDEIIPVEVGGISDQQIKQMAFTREILRRGSGMTENAVGAQEGGEAGGSTATEAAIIDEGAQTRMAFVQQRINQALCQSGRSAGWFLFHDKKSVIHLGEEAGDALNMLQPTYFGGAEADDDFDDLGIEIDVMSMPWSGQNQEKQNAVALLQQICTVAPLVTTVPAIDWKDVLNRIGDAFNESDLGEIIDEELAQQQMQAEQEIAANESNANIEGQNREQDRADEEHGQKMQTEQVKRGTLVAGAQDKRMVAQATVKEKQMKGKSYGARAKAGKR